MHISVIEAIKHAAASNNSRPEIKYIDSIELERDESKLRVLDELDGVVIPGGFGAKGVEGKIMAIKYCRENNIPILGICYGFQLMVVEYARSVLGLDGANTTEVDGKTRYPVITLLPDQIEKLKRGEYGATMRLGGQLVLIKKGSLANRLYGRDRVVERFRHRYEVNPKYVSLFEDSGLRFTGESVDGIKQVGELSASRHRYFIGSQYHPEFTSRPLRPNPLFNGLIRAALNV